MSPFIVFISRGDGRKAGLCQALTPELGPHAQQDRERRMPSCCRVNFSTEGWKSERHHWLLQIDTILKKKIYCERLCADCEAIRALCGSNWFHIIGTIPYLTIQYYLLYPSIPSCAKCLDGRAYVACLGWRWADQDLTSKYVNENAGCVLLFSNMSSVCC